MESNIAVLEQKIITTDTVLERLADSFAKMSDVSNSLNRMIGIHDERFANQATYNKETDRTIEEITKAHKQSQSEFFIRMETNEYKLLTMVEEIRKDLRERDATALKTINERDEKLHERISVLERWRYTSLGVIMVISLAAGYLLPVILPH